MAAITKHFSGFATRTAKVAGQPATFALAVALVVVWGATGPLFGFAKVWQLVINTLTTIITFLMTFLLQNSQNRDSEALQAKLDALILVGNARNSFVGVEKLDEDELDERKKALEAKADRAGDALERSASRLPHDSLT